MDQELMTLSMVVKMLKVSKSTIYRWIYDGSIPAIKVGKQWRFEREKIDKWIREKENKRHVSVA